MSPNFIAFLQQNLAAIWRNWILEQKVEFISSILMGMELCYHLTWPVTWLTRTELAWQPLVTTARTEHWWMGVILLGVTHVTFITPERICLSWRVSLTSPHTVSNLSSTSVFTRFLNLTAVIFLDGGCLEIQLKWHTGAGESLVTDAHAEWTTHVQNPEMERLNVNVIEMTQTGVKIAAT